MFFAAIFNQCVNAASAALDRITPERFLKRTAEVVFDPGTIAEALSNPVGLCIILFLLALDFLVLVVGPFVEMLFGDRRRS